MKRILSASLLMMMLFYPGILFSAEQSGTDWKVTTAATYETGKFGTDTTTNTLYVPVMLKRYFDRWNVSLTIPYIYQETGPGVAAIGGQPFQIRKTSGGSRVSDEGLGDLVLKGGYDLLREEEQPFNLAVIGKIKFPTADDQEGLGTGEYDEGTGLEASKRLNAQWTVFSDIYYTFIGSPPGTDLNDETTFDIGLGYDLTADDILSVFYTEKTALLDGRPDPRDLDFNWEHKLNKTTKFFTGFSVGLSDGSPDFGVTGGMAFRF